MADYFPHGGTGDTPRNVTAMLALADAANLGRKRTRRVPRLGRSISWRSLKALLKATISRVLSRLDWSGEPSKPRHTGFLRTRQILLNYDAASNAQIVGRTAKYI